jgi:hypothetical protein
MSLKIEKFISPEAWVEIVKIFIKIGGILAMVLGAIEVIKAIIYIILIGVLGSVALSIFPAISWLANLLMPIGYAYLAGMLIIGIIISLIGYNLYKLGALPSISLEEKNRWIIITVIIMALSLVVGATHVTIAFVISLIGLILLPTKQAPSPLPPSSQPTS